MKNAQYYDEAFMTSEEYKLPYWKSRYYPLWTVIIDRLTPIPFNRSSILELGCGTGQFASFLNAQGYSIYTGVDFSKEGIQQAQTKCPKYQFICEEFQSVDYNILPYNTIICCETLEHLDDDFSLLRSINKHNYRFIGSVPNFGDPAHIRWFATPAHVYMRYSSEFKELTITPIRITEKNILFLMDGVF